MLEYAKIRFIVSLYEIMLLVVRLATNNAGHVLHYYEYRDKKYYEAMESHIYVRNLG